MVLGYKLASSLQPEADPSFDGFPVMNEGEAPTYSTDLVRRQETRSSAEDQDKSMTILSSCVNIVATRLLPLEEKIGFC
jgi:hypothetical protein